MSLPKPGARTSSIDVTCLSQSIGGAAQDISRLHVSTALPPQGHLLTLWHGEISPISSSSACNTPLENQPADVGVLGVDLGLLAIADGNESIHVPHTDIKQDQVAADEIPDTVRVETIDATSYESEYEDEGDEWYQPKGGLIVTTPHKPLGLGKPTTGSAVGKPSNGTGPKK